MGGLETSLCYEEFESVNYPGPDAAKTFSRGDQGDRHVAGVGGVFDDDTARPDADTAVGTLSSCLGTSGKDGRRQVYSPHPAQEVTHPGCQLSPPPET